MKTPDLTTPALEAFLALQRVAMQGAEELAQLNIDAVRALSQQAAAAQNLPNAAGVAPWLAHEAMRLPERIQSQLDLSRRAAAICATTTADWLGVCAERSQRLSGQSLDALAGLQRLLPGERSLGPDAGELKRALEQSHAAYNGLLQAFRQTSAALEQVQAAPSRRRA